MTKSNQRNQKNNVCRLVWTCLNPSCPQNIFSPFFVFVFPECVAKGSCFLSWVSLTSSSRPVYGESEKRWCVVWSVKCGVWGVMREVCSVKCEVCTVKCDVWSVKCRVWSVECEVGVWSVKRGVWSVKKCEVWSVKCGAWSEVWRVKCVVISAL